MKTVFTIIVLLVVSVIIYFFILGYVSQSKPAPNSKSDASATIAPGLSAGKLSFCSPKPNCVCSEKGERAEASITPLSVSDENMTNALNKSKDVIIQMGGSIVSATDEYISATFTSGLFRFVDDFEIRLDEQNKLIHIRSSSRVGHSDFGVNRKRVEEFKQFMMN